MYRDKNRMKYWYEEQATILLQYCNFKIHRKIKRTHVLLSDMSLEGNMQWWKQYNYGDKDTVNIVER